MMKLIFQISDLDNLNVDTKPEPVKTVPMDDPMINSQKATDSGGFKPLHSMQMLKILRMKRLI